MFISDLVTSHFKELPTLSKVYFFYDQNDNLVYIGKSINIRKRVQQHFSAKDRKSIKIQIYVKRVSYEVMGSELIALLYESELIKQHKPLFNRAQRNTIYQYGLYRENSNNYKALRISKIIPAQQELTVFSTYKEAQNALYAITEKYGLCHKINGLYKTTSSCFQYHIKECKGACVNQENETDYNKRVDQFISRCSLNNTSILIEVNGRNDSEIGLVWIQNGVYKGYGFCPKNTSDKTSFIAVKQDNKDIRRILNHYLLKNKLSEQ